jgi:hypothetical protein
VLPTGEIVAHPARGTLMGNRGILHDHEGRLGRSRWRHPHWISCRLKFGARRRRIMAPGAYTELFFLDEAVALAAGHRPCAECRRSDYTRFLDCWEAATGTRPRARELDRALHAARLVPGTRRQATVHMDAAALPDGCIFRLAGGMHLLVGDAALPFSLDGYGPPADRPGGGVEVLTPAPIVEVLRAGYRPELHRTALT